MSIPSNEGNSASRLDFINYNTKMDLRVDGYKEVAGPLGGLSVEYLLNVSTTLPAYKTSLQSESAVVSFTVSKTYKEFEYFYRKLKGKYPKLDLPDISIQNPLFVEDKDARQKIVDKFMKFVSGDPILASSEMLIDFLGYDPHKSNTQPTSSKVSSTVKIPIVDDPLQNNDVKHFNSSRSHKAVSENIFTNESEEDDEDIFQEFNHQNVTDSTPLFSEISPPKEQRGGHLLFQHQDLGGALEKCDESIYVPLDARVDADDKSHMTMRHLEDTTELLKIDDSLSDIFGELQQDTAKSNKPKPPLPPKPHVSPKPSIRTKPTPSPRPQNTSPVSTRPVPPPRTTLVSKPQVAARKGNKPEGLVPIVQSEAVDSSVTGEISTLDILSYIKSEENVQNENLDLF